VSDPRSLNQMIADCRAQFVDGRLPTADPAAPGGATPAPEPRRPPPMPENKSIPEPLRWASLQAPELRRRVARERAIAEGEAALGAPAVVLVGPSGSGKTTLACALLRAWEAKHPRRRAVFALATRLAVARIEHGFGHGQAPEIERALEAGLLLLDDVGTEGHSAWNAVPDVILERVTYGRPIWVTTWMSPEQAAQRYGDGVARRLFEAGRSTVIACGRAS